MSKLLEALSDYGVDMKTTLSRFVEDEELYADCIHDFLWDENFGLLESAMEAKDYGASFHHAHTLKGVAANLGLAPLHKAVSDLVEALRAQEYRQAEERSAQVRAERDRLQAVCGE